MLLKKFIFPFFDCSAGGSRGGRPYACDAIPTEKDRTRRDEHFKPTIYLLSSKSSYYNQKYRFSILARTVPKRQKVPFRFFPPNFKAQYSK